MTDNPVNTAIAGDYTVTYRVTDSAGIAAFPATRLVQVRNQAPSFASNPGGTAREGSAYNYDVEVQDPESDALTITAPTLPTWLELTDNGDGTASLSGTPRSGDVGDAEVILEVSDGVNAPVQQTFTISVSAAPAPAPAATGGGGATGPWQLAGLMLLSLLVSARRRDRAARAAR